MKATLLLTLFIFSLRLCLLANNPTTTELDTIYKNLTIEQSDSLIKANATNTNFVIIDVRRPEEYVISHIPNSLNIDFYSESFGLEINKLDKQKKYLIYCRVTNRSGQTLDLMRQLGFHEVYRMYGGITEWVEKGFPYEVGTGASNTPALENVKLYPNPCSSYIYIETGTNVDCTIELLNTNGLLLFKSEYKNSRQPIFMGDKAKGIYICKITCNKGIRLLKFSVE